MTERKKEKLYSILMAILTFGHYPFVETGTHKDMVRMYTRKCLKVTFPEYEREFNKVSNWCIDTKFPDSLFITPFDRNTQCHANIYSINGLGFIFSSYGLYKARKLVRNKIKELENQIYLSFANAN